MQFKLKLLYVCYTLALRFDLKTVTESTADSIIKNILEGLKVPSKKEKESSFTGLSVSYKVTREEAKGPLLEVMVRSGDLVWLYQRLPLSEGGRNTPGPAIPSISTDFAIRDRFLYDSMIVQHVSMKAGLTFKSTNGKMRVPIEPVAESKPTPSLMQEAKPPPSSANQEAKPLPQNAGFDGPEEDFPLTIRSSSQEEISEPKESADPFSETVLVTFPEGEVPAFSWKVLKESPLAKILQFLDPLEVGDFACSPFQLVMQGLLSSSATFLSRDAFRTRLAGQKDANVVVEESIGSIFESMLLSGSHSDASQISQINEATQLLLGHSLELRVPLCRLLDHYISARELEEPPAQVTKTLQGSDQLLEPVAQEKEKDRAMKKKLWLLCQLLADSDIPPSTIRSKFLGFVQDTPNGLQQLERLFKVPLYVSHEPRTLIRFASSREGYFVAWEEASSTFRQVLLLLTTIHRRVGGSFFLDQPEASLSISMQQQMCRHILQQLSGKSMLLITDKTSFLPSDCMQVAVRVSLDSEGAVHLSTLREGILSKVLRVDPGIRQLLFAQKVLLVDGAANLRLINGLYDLLESEPEVIDTLECNLNRNGLALDVERLLNWTVMNPQAASGVHPYVVTYGYQIPTLVVSSTAAVQAPGQPLSQESVMRTSSFQYIQQVYGETKQANLLEEIFREVEGLRGTLQKLQIQKAQHLREEERGRMQELEDQLRPSLNAAEAQLRPAISQELSQMGIFSWEYGAGHMIAKTPLAAKKLYSAWAQLPATSESTQDSQRAQQWLRDLETDPKQCEVVWRFLPLPAVTAAVRLLIMDENEEFIRLCASLGRQPELTKEAPFLPRR